MAGSVGKKQRSRGFYLMLYLFLLIFVIGPVVLSLTVGMKDSVGYEAEYYLDPLQMKKVKVIDRGTSYGAFDLGEGNVLYEVVITYENIGWYTAEYGKQPEFFGVLEDGTEEYLGEAWYYSDSELVYDAMGEEPIPAGKTGSRRYYVEVWPGMQSLIVRETADKLEGDKKVVTVLFPEAENESISVMAGAELNEE